MPPTIAPNPVDAALVALLSADIDPDYGFMALAPGGPNHLVAPENSPQPYCVFGLTQPTRDTYTMGGLAFVDCLYGFDVIQEGSSAERCQAAAARLNTLLTDTTALAPTGWVVMSCRRQGYQERLERTDGGVLYQHVQSTFAITIRPA